MHIAQPVNIHSYLYVNKTTECIKNLGLTSDRKLWQRMLPAGKTKELAHEKGR